MACDAHLAGSYAGLGAIYERNGQDFQAVQMYRRSIDLDASQPEPHYKLARALQRIGRVAEAKKAFERFGSIHAESRTKAEKALRDMKQRSGPVRPK